jgi:hypothetical protein
MSQKSAELRYDIVLYCTTDAAVFNESQRVYGVIDLHADDHQFDEIINATKLSLRPDYQSD